MSETVAENLSILVPTYNRQNFLAVCLDSLLLQKCKGYELLIRDNHSPDNTQEVCAEYANKFAEKGVTFRYTKNPRNVGFRDNMVHGLHELNHQYAMILMDDDFLINSHALSSLYKSIDSNARIKLATSPAYQHRKMLNDDSVDFVFDKESENVSVDFKLINGDNYFLNAWTKYPPLVLSSVIFDRVAILNSEWEDWSSRAALDVNMYNILSLQGDVAVFNNSFVAYRIHDSQDFGNLPLEDCYATHERVLDWFQLAKKTGRFSFSTLFMWRFKTVILKDQGIVKRLYQRKNQDVETYFYWLRNYNFWHFFIMRMFMPECIRHTRRLNTKGNVITVLFTDLRRQVLRVFLHIYRSKYDQDYQQPFFEAFRGGK